MANIPTGDVQTPPNDHLNTLPPPEKSLLNYASLTLQNHNACRRRTCCHHCCVWFEVSLIICFQEWKLHKREGRFSIFIMLLVVILLVNVRENRRLRGLNFKFLGCFFFCNNVLERGWREFVFIPFEYSPRVDTWLVTLSFWNLKKIHIVSLASCKWWSPFLSMIGDLWFNFFIIIIIYFILFYF